MESTYKHFGTIDILVNAAAGNFLASAEDLTPKGFQTGCVFIMFHSDYFSFLNENNLNRKSPSFKQK